MKGYLVEGVFYQPYLSLSVSGISGFFNTACYICNRSVFE